jgi:hypothetical protein
VACEGRGLPPRFTVRSWRRVGLVAESADVPRPVERAPLREEFIHHGPRGVLVLEDVRVSPAAPPRPLDVPDAPTVAFEAFEQELIGLHSLPLPLAIGIDLADQRPALPELAPLLRHVHTYDVIAHLYERVPLGESLEVTLNGPTLIAR